MTDLRLASAIHLLSLKDGVFQLASEQALEAADEIKRINHNVKPEDIVRAWIGDDGGVMVETRGMYKQ